MTQLRQFGIWQKVLLAVTTEFQKDTGQPALVMIEKLVANILFQIDVADQQRGYELFGKLGLRVKSLEHGPLLNFEYC